MNERRASRLTFDDMDNIREIMRKEIEESRSLRKNGSTWRSWLVKLFTPERVLLAVILVFQFGGNVADARRRLNEASRLASEAAEKAGLVAKQADAAAAAVESARVQIDGAQEQLRGVSVALEKQSQFNRDLDERIRRDVTRSEFMSVVQQQILPRLQRIEDEVRGKPKL